MLPIEAARMLYRESISNRDLLLSIFTKEELEDNCVNKKVVTQEEFNKFFEENILSKGEWLLDYDYNPRNTHFKYHYNRVYIILRDKFSLQDDELQVLMKSLIESHFYLKGVASQRIGSFL